MKGKTKAVAFKVMVFGIREDEKKIFGSICK